MHKEEFEDKDQFLLKYGTISTETQVTELQEILRKYYTSTHISSFGMFSIYFTPFYFILFYFILFYFI